MITTFFSNLIIYLNSHYELLNLNTFMQFLTIYSIYCIYSVMVTYYTVFYLIFGILMCGVTLAFFNMDLFTAFLFMSESVIVFVSILLIFYLNVYTNTLKSNKYNNLNQVIGLICICFFSTNSSINESDNFGFYKFNSLDFYDNFYERLLLDIFNDLYGLFINFFFLNNISYLSVGLLLLVASLICVSINILSKDIKLQNYNNLFLLFDFFKDSSKFIFMRKQNLIDQLFALSSIKYFVKKTD